jgi:RHS repeat-associated protein
MKAYKLTAVALMILLCTSMAMATNCLIPGWVINVSTVEYQAYSTGGTYPTLTIVVSYSYGNGAWHQQFARQVTGRGVQVVTDYGSPSYVEQTQTGGSVSIWNGDTVALYNTEGCTNSQSVLNESLFAKQMADAGYIDYVLKNIFPRGPSDPNFGQQFHFLVDFSDPTMQPQQPATKNDIIPATKGDPVYTNNGEFSLSATDIALPARTLPVIIERSYGSKRDYNGQFGFGWDFNYNMKVRHLSSLTGEPNSIMLLDGHCNRREYLQDFNAPTTYKRSDDLSNYITDNGTTVKLLEKTGVEYDFDTNGNLADIRDLNGNMISFTYTSGLVNIQGPSTYFNDSNSGKYGLIAHEYQLTSITDDTCRSITFGYNVTTGLLQTITDYANRTWTYTHDPYTNDLLSVCDPNGLTTSYGYDYNHHLLSITDPNNQEYLVNEYDFNNMVIQQLNGNGYYKFDYNPNLSKTVTTNRNNHKIETVFNAAGQICKDTIFTDDANAEPNQFTTQHFYDSHNQVTRTILPDGNCIDYTYNGSGNLTGIFRKTSLNEPNDANSPYVIGICYTYDINFPNKVRTVRDPEGHITTFNYNSYGNIDHITYPQVTIATGPFTPVAYFTYNSYGQIETAQAADGIVTKYEYYETPGDSNNYGRLHYVTADYGQEPNCLNLKTTYAYDATGNVVSIIDPNNNEVKTKYNTNDLPTEVTSPSPFNYIARFSYTNNKKLVVSQKTLGTSTQVFKYSFDKLDYTKTLTDPLNHSFSYGRDNSENLTTITDAENHETQQQYNERDLLWKVIDANSSVTERSYNKNGNLAWIKDAHGNITTYGWDNFGRLHCITYPDSTTEVVECDKSSNILSEKTRANQTIYFGYDVLNRMAWKRLPGEPNIYFTYDSGGRVTQIQDNLGTFMYDFDHIGRIKDAVDTTQTRTVSYRYDNLGRRTKLIYPDNSFIQYKYDSLSRLTDILNDSNNVIAHYGYDSLSRRTTLLLDNDANTSYSYDLANRLENITNYYTDANNPGRSWQSKFDYTHDNVGNRKTITLNTSSLYQYNYDSLYQLRQVTCPNSAVINYNFDAIGNRINVTGALPASYAQNASHLNQYGSVDGVIYGYDNNGNLTYDGTYLYYYDCQNRLTDVNTAGNVRIAHYDYDYRGRRVAKTIGATTTHYCYDGDQIIAEYSNNGTLLKKYIFGPGTDEPICMSDVVSGKMYYFHFDGIGSVIALSDSNGTLVEQYSYDSFGKPNTTSTVGNRFMFTGREYDPEIGLYYYRARYYKPEIGRFLQTDPVGYADSMNPYLYCGNNSINWADPYGLCKGESLFDRFLDYMQSSPSLISYGGFSVGLFESIYGAEAATYNTFRHPIDTVAGIPSAIANIPTNVGQFYDEITSSDPYIYGNAVGHLTGTVEVAIATSSAGQATTPKSIITPHGTAVQSISSEALELQESVADGQQIFRGGNFPKSAASEGQYWSPQNPLTPGYANSVGAANLGTKSPDFILGGTVRPGADFITRPAPPFGGNAGGALEIVTQPGSVQIDFFHMP